MYQHNWQKRFKRRILTNIVVGTIFLIIFALLKYFNLI